MKKSIILFLCLVFTGMNFHAQTVFGKWKTINDETGISHSIVEIYKDKETGEVKGKLVRMLKEEMQDKLCTLCEGDRKNEPLEGLLIMEGLEKQDSEYVGGVVMDPKTGKEYKCKIWVDEDNPDQLKVRGYMAFLYRTQVWERHK
ncbi:DUF2147 domain-containing protein [Gillisia limnaea]|uniref:DUF2147 domain-containing protein n=1 Tax=Gillisia limnaea (strain DSM 15749 / LMG 21470 / R-8282) TaxID=865937 RepID=H2BVL5_GILLR|nr:DUF2147 domain-containing protein [Gillisia limnaea]EHQ03971.1 Protein of unknown function DUF2147 [Gillisia limnaea DSM 15749]